MNTGLDQYMDIFKDAVEDSAAKLTKSFEKILIEYLLYLFYKYSLPPSAHTP